MAIKTTPVSVLQVEMGEQLLEIRRRQIAPTWWVKLKGHRENHQHSGERVSCHLVGSRLPL